MCLEFELLGLVDRAWNYVCLESLYFAETDGHVKKEKKMTNKHRV